MRSYEISKTLVKSPPELWAELRGDRLAEAIEGAAVRPTEEERALAWEARGARGTALLEPSGWGTKVTLTAEVDEGPREVEEEVAGLEPRASRLGFWARLRGARPPAPPPPRPTHADIEQRLRSLLDDLGSARRKPFARE
jgi:hypothetical protein